MPGDLLGTALFAVLTLAFTLLPPLDDLPVRIPLGLAMVLFLPGYALIAALFPRRDDLDGIERIALSFGLSIAVVPLIGLGLNYTPWGIRLVPVVISLAVFTVAMAGAAYFRRCAQPSQDRFSVDLRENLAKLKEEVMAESSSRLDKALTVILIITIILSISALAYVIVIPKQGEKFTEFYILGPGGKAYDYPTKVDPGNSSTVIVGVVNHEYALTNYTMRLIFRNATLLSRTIRLDHNETWEHPVSYVLKDPGRDNKLQFLLYRESNFTAPYRDLHLWINVLPRNETESPVPMVSLPEIQKEIFMGYANKVPQVFNASRIRHSHRDDRPVTNETAEKESLNAAALPLSDKNLTNETGTVPIVGRSDVNLSRLMNRSMDISKSYPRVNITLIDTSPSQPFEALENMTKSNATPVQAEANDSNDPDSALAEDMQSSQPQMQRNVTQAEVMPGEAPANITPAEPKTGQEGATQEIPGSIAPAKPQDSQSEAGSKAAAKPMVLGKGPIQKTVQLGRGSTGG